ncbi:histidine phosphatase family protein [Sphingobium sufflavum]|uniref:SixA phosphatase family protein n=1 Tax=Sphingobium sufflavum TaxID=1129547 RepID=UPI001F30CB22|nr:histidine phosphatase family protein [Sphingobium sufflavum]MCE7798812.1 histidine phosphatase family protein [Sphingobium sufflavum]
MKTVILLRHAKSDWNDSVARDFDRPLNGRGKRAARRMGAWARDENLRFDAIIASPAVRVTETLDHFLDAYGQSIDPRWDRRIYLASAATLLDVLRDLPDDLATVLMVGHNPGLEDLVLDIVPDDGPDDLRVQVETKYPTAAIATVQFAADRWTDVARPGTLTTFVRPRDLDAALGPDVRQH